ncbi:MAG: chorismate mutase [Elusimicrobia bacterium]|nr:chorismate mutase [Elusimicrobiota bacterium]
MERELSAIRRGIDAVDNALVRLLARRRALSVRLARVKRAVDLPIYDRVRERALFGRVKAWGVRHGLDEEFVEVLFRLIVMNSKEVQYHEDLRAGGRSRRVGHPKALRRR